VPGWPPPKSGSWQWGQFFIRRARARRRPEHKEVIDKTVGLPVTGRYGARRNSGQVQRLVYARPGRELMGRRSPVNESW